MGIFDSEVFKLRHMKRAAASSSSTSCPSGQKYYSKTCPGDPNLVYYGCWSEDPCVAATASSSASASSSAAASASATTSSSAAASSSTAAASSTAAKTSQTKTTTSASSSHPRSSSSTPSSSSQTSSTASTTSAQIGNSVAAASSASAKTAPISASSHSNTGAIAGGTIGAIVGAIIALVLILLVLRWRKRRAEDRGRATQDDSDLRLQQGGVNGAGDATQDKDGDDSVPAHSYANHNSLWNPGTNNADNEGHAYKRRSIFSGVPPSLPIRPGTELAGSLPDSTGKRPELEVPASRIPAELSPNTEHSLINIPQQTPNPSRENSGGEGGVRETGDGSVMHSNLDLTGDETGGLGGKKDGKSHVMSWMNYDSDDSGPVR